MSAKRKSINLIDLSIEEESLEQQIASKNSNESSLLTQNCVRNEFENSMPICGQSKSGGESFDNNPFDRVQRQVNYLDDPFEMVIQEISQNNIKTRNEVETGNLLLLDDDISDGQKLLSEAANTSSRIKTNDLSSLDPITIEHSESYLPENITSTDLTNKDNTATSLPFEHLAEDLLNLDQSSKMAQEVTLESRKLSDSVETPDSSKCKNVKSAEYRKRLLKLSISNSSINSPLSRRTSKSSESSSPMTAVCKEAELLANKMTEMVFNSPESFEDSCDDLMSIEPKWVESEGDIDSDIEMMNIPILKEINSPQCCDEKMNVKDADKLLLNTTPETVVGKHLQSKDTDLEILRERVKLQRMDCSKASQDPASLISNLKNLISECSSDMKKSEANSLLESLSSIFNVSEAKENNVEVSTPKQSTLPPPPQPIIRQGTFDIDPKDKNENSSTVEKTAHEQMKNETMDYLSPNITHKEDNEELNTPEKAQPDISSIVDQIGRLLGNQNVNVVQANLTTPCKGNPTYIVVMNTPIMPDIKRSALFNNQESSSEILKSDNTTRRRSQSLSIHDKSKLPLTKQPVHTNQNEIKILGRGGYAARRNSFSTPTQANTPCVSTNARRSMYNLNRDTSQKPLPRKLLLETHHENKSSTTQVQTKPLATIKPEINTRKFKLKANESVTKKQGPLKATIPMIVTSSPIDNLNIKKDTSTNVSNANILGSNLYPNACSTPGNGYSPSRNLLKTKSRYSNLPVSPASKSSSFQTRRRTMSDVKSPRKRIDIKTSMGISKPVAKSLKLPQGLSKAINKLTTNKMASKPLTKTMEHNKENNKPSFG